jgi:hypothetical protein
MKTLLILLGFIASSNLFGENLESETKAIERAHETVSAARNNFKKALASGECKMSAPPLGAKNENIEVGRTSHKLRNQTNQPRDWVKPILEEFMMDSRSCDYVIGHNISFDINMVQWSLERFKNEDNVSVKKCERMIQFMKNSLIPKTYCTMRNNIKRCGIQKIGVRGPYLKFPKLSELHFVLFQTVPTGLHNALIDVYACLRCYCKTIYNNDLVIINSNVRTIYNL